MRKTLLLLAFLLLSGFTYAGNYTASGAPPPNCNIGDQWFNPNAVVTQRFLICVAANVWQVRGQITKTISMPDDTATPVYSVSLPTNNTGYSTHISFVYSVTDATNTASHAGILICSFVNQLGTVSGSCTDTGEATAGTGCGNACDTATVTVSTTTATVNERFNNTLSQTGSFFWVTLNNTCATLTAL